MPLYVYYCKTCQKEFEILHRSYDDSVDRTCPQCGGIMERKMSVCSFSFGWRLTDRSLYGGKGDPKDEYEKDV